MIENHQQIILYKDHDASNHMEENAHDEESEQGEETYAEEAKEIGLLLEKALDEIQQEIPSIAKGKAWEKVKKATKHLQHEDLQDLFGKHVTKEKVLETVKSCTYGTASDEPTRHPHDFCTALRDVAKSLPAGKAWKLHKLVGAAVATLGVFALTTSIAYTKGTREGQNRMKETYHRYILPSMQQILKKERATVDTLAHPLDPNRAGILVEKRNIFGNVAQRFMSAHEVKDTSVGASFWHDLVNNVALFASKDYDPNVLPKREFMTTAM